MCIWIYRPLTVNSATPRGPGPTGWEPRKRTSLWLMTPQRAWGTSAGLPSLLSSWPSHFLPETLHSTLFTENIFCINFNKLVMASTMEKKKKQFFMLKSKLHLEWTLVQQGEKSFQIQDAPVLLLHAMIFHSLSMCCMTLPTSVTCVFNNKWKQKDVLHLSLAVSLYIINQQANKNLPIKLLLAAQSTAT